MRGIVNKVLGRKTTQQRKKEKRESSSVSGQLRQGDVLLHPVFVIPDGATELNGEGRIIIAEGEATGHAHAIKSGTKTKVFATGTGEMYLEVNEPVMLEHEEHSHIEVKPGVYQVRRQVEVWMEEARMVVD